MAVAAFLCFSAMMRSEGAPVVEEQANYDVILTVTGPSKIAVIKEVRAAIAGIGLADAKILVESAPQPIKRGLTKTEVEELKQKFESAGAKVTVESAGVEVELNSDPASRDTNGRYDVILSETGPSKVAVIKEVREAVSGIGLADAKTFVETAPHPVVRGVTKDEAERLKQKFEAAGAKVIIQ